MMKIKHYCQRNFLILFLCFFLFCQSFDVYAKNFSCHVTKNGITYRLDIEKSKSRVETLSYKSITTDATQSTCEISVRRDDNSDESIWKDVNQENVISIEIPSAIKGRKMSEVILLHETPSAYHVRLLHSSVPEVHHMECGLIGVLSSEITLSKGKNICKLE